MDVNDLLEDIEAHIARLQKAPYINPHEEFRSNVYPMLQAIVERLDELDEGGLDEDIEIILQLLSLQLAAAGELIQALETEVPEPSDLLKERMKPFKELCQQLILKLAEVTANVEDVEDDDVEVDDDDEESA